MPITPLRRFPCYVVEDVWQLTRDGQKIMAIKSPNIVMFFTSNNPILVLLCLGLVIGHQYSSNYYNEYGKMRGRIEKMLGVING